MFIPLSVLEFRDRAENYFREKVGVIDGDKQFTYGEFARRTHQLANALRQLGIQRGDRVSFLTYNSHPLLEAYFGVIEAGAIFNPINVRLGAEDIAYILNHSGAKALFFHNDFTTLIQTIRPALTSAPHLIVIERSADVVAPLEYEQLLSDSSAEYQPPELDENEIAELFYISSDAGKPFGAALSHRNLHLHALYMALGLGISEADVLLHVVPLTNASGWGAPHFLTMVGGTHVLMRQFDPAALLKLVQEHRVTHLFGTPLIFNSLIYSPELLKHDHSSLKLLVSGGAPASSHLIREMELKLGGTAVVGYGLTETVALFTVARSRQHVTSKESPEMKMQRQAMTGWAIPGIQLRVVNTDGSDVRPYGKQIGEIIVRSNLVMSEYYNDADATQRALRDGWFHTGDMATLDAAGYLLIKDRAKDIIISGGENISSVEIERALYAHPAVAECCVVAAPDALWGEVPVAFVVLKQDTPATEEELLTDARGHLASFMVPKWIEFRAQLPKDSAGKILKAELREEFWRGLEKKVH